MFDPKKPKARFCSDKCRVYGNREKKATEKVVKVVDANKPTTTIKNLTESKPKSNYTIDTTQMEPQRKDFADNWAYLTAKAEWKSKV